MWLLFRYIRVHTQYLSVANVINTFQIFKLILNMINFNIYLRRCQWSLVDRMLKYSSSLGDALPASIGSNPRMITSFQFVYRLTCPLKSTSVVYFCDGR